MNWMKRPSQAGRVVAGAPPIYHSKNKMDLVCHEARTWKAGYRSHITLAYQNKLFMRNRSNFLTNEAILKTNRSSVFFYNVGILSARLEVVIFVAYPTLG